MKGEATSDDLVPVGHAYGQMEAALACSMLEAAGIYAHAQTRHAAAVAWHYTVALGGIAIMVPARQARDAHNVLADFQPCRSRRWPLTLLVLGGLASLWIGVSLPPSGYFAVRRPTIFRSGEM